jgi:hypothetical protein
MIEKMLDQEYAFKKWAYVDHPYGWLFLGAVFLAAVVLFVYENRDLFSFSRAEGSGHPYKPGRTKARSNAVEQKRNTHR